MYDFAFDARGLDREFIRSDFGEDIDLVDPAKRAEIVAEAKAQASNGLASLDLHASRVRSRNLYQPTNLPQQLILRKLARNIRRLTRVKQNNRDSIIKSLKSILADGHMYRVYKLDIRRFYESIDPHLIADMFSNDSGFPPTSLFVFKSIAFHLKALNIQGLPHGLAISATLSEYAMREFDKAVNAQESVYFYARYVDDAIIVTTCDENKSNFIRRLNKSLPNGVSFNNGKCRIIDFDRPKINNVANITPEDYVDFLGYRFTVFGQCRHNSVISRRVDVDMSPNKVRRIKSRICLSMIQYLNDGNIQDLNDRLMCLSSNYNIYDYDKKIRRNIGVYWNYRHIDLMTSTALNELDEFVRRIILARTGKLATRLRAKLSDADRRWLLRISFRRAFESKEFQHFNAARLSHLVGCWTYE